MARGSFLQHVRKAGAFSNGQLKAGEWGLDTVNSTWYYSLNGTTVIALATGAPTNNATFTGTHTVDTTGAIVLGDYSENLYGKYIRLSGLSGSPHIQSVGNWWHNGSLRIDTAQDITLGDASGNASGSYLYISPGVEEKIIAYGSFDVSGGSLSATGAIKSTGTQGIGYDTGAGGAVTQATSKATSVTLNKICGIITMQGAALASNTTVSFTLSNTLIATMDVVNVSIRSGATIGAYLVTVSATAANSCTISLRNVSGGSLSESVALNFVVIKAVTS